MGEGQAKFLRRFLYSGFRQVMAPSCPAIRRRDDTDDIMAAVHKGAETGLCEIRGAEEDDAKSGRGCFLHAPRI